MNQNILVRQVARGGGMVGRSMQRDEGGKPNSAGGPGMRLGIRTSHRV